MINQTRLLRILLCLLLTLQVPPVHAAAAGAGSPAAGQTWQINLKEADINDFIDQVARITGRNFVVDQRVKGRITIISSANLDKEGVWELFLTVLRVQGFAAVPTGDIYRVTQQAIARQGGTEIVEQDIGGDQLVTRVMTTKNVQAEELMKVLRPLVPQYGHLGATTNPNVLIITDHAENILRLEQIVQQLDVAESLRVEIIELEDAWVGTVADLLQQLAPEDFGGMPKGPGGGTRFSVVANERNNTLVLRGPREKIEEYRALIKQLDRPATSAGSTRVIYLRHAAAVDVAEIIKALIQGETRGQNAQQARSIAPTIQADESLNAIVIRAEPSVVAEVQAIIERLDVRRVQVLIEAAIVEVALDGDNTLGVDLSVADAGADGGNLPLATSPFAGVVGSVISSLTAAGLTDADSAEIGSEDLLTAAAGLDQPTLAVARFDTAGVSFGAVIQAISNTNKSDLLSTPSILTLDNQEAKIVVGQNVPFRTGSFTSDNNGSNNPFTTIERQDVGITLAVTPHIHDGEVVRLEVSQEVSSVVNAAVGAGGFSDIVTNKRTLETTILANDGEVIVLGGLMQDDLSEIESRVPLLGRIPGVGALFRSRTKAREKRNLMVFLRPTVLRSIEDADQTTRIKYEGIWSLGDRLKDREEMLEGRESALDVLFDPAPTPLEDER